MRPKVRPYIWFKEALASPVPVLRPPLDICKPTGVTLGPGRRVIVMPDQHGLAKALAERRRLSEAEPTEPQ